MRKKFYENKHEMNTVYIEDMGNEVETIKLYKIKNKPIDLSDFIVDV